MIHSVQVVQQTQESAPSHKNHRDISLIVHIAITAIGLFLILVMIPAKQMALPLSFEAELATIASGGALLVVECIHIFISSFFCKNRN